jgi:GAF domain-containing protein
MSFSLSLQPDQSDEQIYHDLLPQVKMLVDKNDHLLSNLSNFTALLKEAFQKISWVGFYLYDGQKLVLGPFQGKVACTAILVGRGVCGKAAADKETVIVPDVHKFPGHIACDSGSNSEIVVPLLKNGALLGVLDIDSYLFDAFSATDKKYLEQMAEHIVREIATGDLLI